MGGGRSMAMSKEEKNARARARYAALKAAGAPPGYKKRGARMEFPAERFPTVKHGARYGGEGNQVGLIGPPRKYKKGAAKPPAAKKGTAPPMVRKAVARVAGGVKTKKLRKSRRKGAVTIKLPKL